MPREAARRFSLSGGDVNVRMAHYRSGGCRNRKGVSRLEVLLADPEQAKERGGQPFASTPPRASPARGKEMRTGAWAVLEKRGRRGGARAESGHSFLALWS